MLGRGGGASPPLPLSTRMGTGLALDIAPTIWGSQMDTSAGIWDGGGPWDRHGNVLGVMEGSLRGGEPEPGLAAQVAQPLWALLPRSTKRS